MPRRFGRRTALLAGLVVLGAALAAVWLWGRPGGATAPVAPSQRETPGEPVIVRALFPAPVAVAPGVFLLGRTLPAAAYIVDTSDGLVLIDSGLESSAAAVTEQLTALHLNVARLKAILLSHVHADHSLGAERLRALTGAKIYAGRGDCPPLRAGGPREAFLGTSDMPKLVLHATTVDVPLAGGESLQFGEARFEVIATPGHTPGSVCYLMERPGLRALFTGDVIQHLGTSNGPALGTYSAYLPPPYRGDARDYLASLRRLRDLPLPDLVLPGHPHEDIVPRNPHLSPERWHELLDGGIAEMETLLARYQADGASFLDGTPKELLPGLRYLGDCGGLPVYCLNGPRGLFLFDAPGGPGLIAFLAEAFKKLGWAGRKPTAVLLTSASEPATAGLADLVRSSGCEVVVSKVGLEAVRRLCPPGTKVLGDDDLTTKGWFEVRCIPLQGRGLAPLTYVVTWAGKTVLISGRIPVKMSLAAAEQLAAEVNSPGGSPDGYQKSLECLAEVHPALWLTALPVHGQNANLYDDDWTKVLEQNRRPLH